MYKPYVTLILSLDENYATRKEMAPLTRSHQMPKGWTNKMFTLSLSCNCSMTLCLSSILFTITFLGIFMQLEVNMNRLACHMFSFVTSQAHIYKLFIILDRLGFHLVPSGYRGFKILSFISCFPY